MCGIVGILEFDERVLVEPRTITRMCDTIRHRGPDDAGQYAVGNVGLGMRRLAIIDVAGGRQPIGNEDGSVWLICNGEIYNHAEVRQSLERGGHVFRTATDAEVIVHLWEEHGPGCLQALRGMFAFALWDAKQRELFLARDRLGIKPLFYHCNGSRLVFGSEIKAILASGLVDDEPNWTSIDAHFAYGYIPAPLTAYRHIAKLPPAHSLRVRDGRVTCERYWDLDFSRKHRGSEANMVAELTDLLRQTVDSHLMSEVPLGAFLSGGVDSSLIVALMSTVAADPVRTFTIGYTDAGSNVLDERSYAREVSQRFGTRHAEIEVEPDFSRALHAAIEAFDEPFADDGLIPTHHICEEAAKEVTVILTGLGGDENFAGYERYLGLKLSDYYDRVPGWIRRGLVGRLVHSLREERGGGYLVNHLKRFVAAEGLPDFQRWQSYVCVRPQVERRKLYTEPVAKMIDFDLVDRLGWEHFVRLGDGDLLDRALYQDINTYLPEDILALSDRIGMQHSLELRVPFVDHQVVEFCARVPSALKIRGFKKKHLLTQTAKPFVPPAVLRHRKQGFAAPMALWLRRDLRGEMDQFLSARRLEREGVLSGATIQAVVSDHLTCRQLNDKLIFALLAFQVWWEGRTGSKQQGQG